MLLCRCKTRACGAEDKFLELALFGVSWLSLKRDYNSSCYSEAWIHTNLPFLQGVSPPLRLQLAQNIIRRQLFVANAHACFKALNLRDKTLAARATPHAVLFPTVTSLIKNLIRPYLLYLKSSPFPTLPLKTDHLLFQEFSCCLQTTNANRTSQMLTF